jgi:hypothetical protein
MNPIDKRIGELMVRLHLSRRRAEQRAYLEAGNNLAAREKDGETKKVSNRQSDYRLAA